MADHTDEFNQRSAGAGDARPGSICKYLGLREDSETFYLYPSAWNQCHRPGDFPIPVSSRYQGVHCLTAEHVNCPLYLPDWDGTVPAESHGRPTKKRGASQRRKNRKVIFTGIVITLALMGFIAFLGMQGGVARNRTRYIFNQIVEVFRGDQPQNPVRRSTPTPPPPTETFTPAPSRTPPPSATLAPTLTPAPTDTPFFLSPTSETTAFPTPGPGLMTPFGPSGGYLIHVVQAGESFVAIAQLYGTTATVLQALNPTVEGVSLWVGRQIVVPIGVTSAAGLPQFVVHFTTAMTDLFSLADFYQSDPEQIRYYNQLGEGETVPSGRWLIIPLLP